MPTAIPATSSRAISKERIDDPATASSDKEISVVEQAKLNATLTALGGPPLQMPPIPLVVVYNEDIPETTA